jgi:glutamate formiminotransferase/formiminotetrahydrofolate cyclodeaminase
VGALCARSGVMGSWLNVKINAAGFDDQHFLNPILEQGETIAAETIKLEKEIIEMVEATIKG